MSIAIDEAACLDAAGSFTYRPWKMKDRRWLYINLHDGTKVGYLDLALQPFAESPVRSPRCGKPWLDAVSVRTTTGTTTALSRLAPYALDLVDSL
jgi:hypothetical protein